MKKGFALQSLMCLLAVSCTVNKLETMDAIPSDDGVFYASMESFSAPDTKVYVDMSTANLNEDEKTLFLTFWDEKDQISIFNKSTLNQKYEFLGSTGDNSGYFKKVSTESGGNPVDYVCAVYPYKKATSLDDSGVLTLTLPDEQTYREGSFGLEANTMVSTNAGKENLLRFKNVGGYLVFKFYGQGPDNSKLSIASVKLEGRNGELLSGKATMIPVIDENPTINMASTAGTSITLKCDKAVKLEKTKNKATLFWMVVPPTTFSRGFKVTVTDKDENVFIKETDKELTIERSRVSTLAAVEVKLGQAEFAGHAYIDMGNGLKWATMNLGAASEADYGDYFAWGETETKEAYTMGNYVLADIPETETNPDFTGWKYINKYTFADGWFEGIWYNDSQEFIGDNKTTFADYDYVDDAARVNWGSTWRIPTKEEWQWLIDNSVAEFVADYKESGKAGIIFTSTINQSELFIPMAGYRTTDLHPDYGRYWSSTLSSAESDYAASLQFTNGASSTFLSDIDRLQGFSVRPVSD